MLVSIIIPTYNEEKYIGKTLDAITRLQRSGIEVEVIVVDAESQDGTQSVIRQYKQHKVKLVSIAHRGIGFARQQGLLMAKGDIVAYTDADTIVPSNWLMEIVQNLQRPGVSGVYGYFRVPDGWWVYRLYVNGAQRFLVRLFALLDIHIAPGQNMAFWREKALSVGGFDKNLTIFEDMEMMENLKKAGKIRFMPRMVVTSSGRRGREGWRFFSRYAVSLWKHYILKKSIKLFPDFR